MQGLLYTVDFGAKISLKFDILFQLHTNICFWEML